MDSRGQLTDFQRIVAFCAVIVAVLLAAMALGWQNAWLLLAATGVVAVVVVSMILTSLRRASQNRELTTARVMAVSARPGGSIVGRCELRLRVHLPGRSPVETRWRDSAVPVVRWPQAGQTLPVDVYGGNPRRLKVRWDLIEQGFTRAPDPARAGSADAGTGTGTEVRPPRAAQPAAPPSPGFVAPTPAAIAPAPAAVPPGPLTVAPAQRSDPDSYGDLAPHGGQPRAGDGTQRIDRGQQVDVPAPPEPHTAVWPIDDGEWPVTTSTVAAGVDPPGAGAQDHDAPFDQEAPAPREPSPTVRLYETWSDPDDPVLAELGLAGTGATEQQPSADEPPAVRPPTSDAYTGTLAGSTTVSGNGHDPDGYDPRDFEPVQIVRLDWTADSHSTPPPGPLDPPFLPDGAPGAAGGDSPSDGGHLVHLDLPDFDPSQVDWSDFQHDTDAPQDSEPSQDSDSPHGSDASDAQHREPGATRPPAGHDRATRGAEEPEPDDDEAVYRPAATIPAPRPAQEPTQGSVTRELPPPTPAALDGSDGSDGSGAPGGSDTPDGPARTPPPEAAETGPAAARTGRPWDWNPPATPTGPSTPEGEPPPTAAPVEPSAGPWHGAPSRIRAVDPTGGTPEPAVPTQEATDAVVPVTDLDRAQRFYVRLLGFDVVSSSTTTVVLDSRGTRIRLEREPDPTLTGSGHSRVPVLDLDATCARLRARGVEIVREPAPIDPAGEPQLWQARVRDPDGNAVTLIERRQRV